VIYKQPEVKIKGWFDRERNINAKKLIIFVLTLCFQVSIFGIYNQIYMREAVREGLKVLNQIKPYAWTGFTLFIVLELVYFHVQILSALKSVGSKITALFTGGCKFDESIETRFDTPLWDA